jgi:hypothetical protein
VTLEAQLLAAAAALVARGWSRTGPAEDRNGALVEPSSPVARRWSPVGALEAVWQHRCRASQDPQQVTGAFERASLALTAVTGNADAWNRAHDRTHQDVIAAFDRAIRSCEDGSTRSRPSDPAAA